MKSPLGITPEKFWKEQRLEDLGWAIRRYVDASSESIVIINKWVDEYSRLYNELYPTKHHWIGLWLTSELEGMICSKCEKEVLDGWNDEAESECPGYIGIDKRDIS